MVTTWLNDASSGQVCSRLKSSTTTKSASHVRLLPLTSAKPPFSAETGWGKLSPMSTRKQTRRIRSSGVAGFAARFVSQRRFARHLSAKARPRAAFFAAVIFAKRTNSLLLN